MGMRRGDHGFRDRQRNQTSAPVSIPRRSSIRILRGDDLADALERARASELKVLEAVEGRAARYATVEVHRD